jgi:hypothetical protein
LGAQSHIPNRILVIDKSALQCLPRNEARWLGFNFMINLTPILGRTEKPAGKLVSDLNAAFKIAVEERLAWIGALADRCPLVRCL